MDLIIILSILIRLVALGWSVVLLRQTRDWRMGFLSIMLGFMTLRQAITLWESRESWNILIPWHEAEFPGLIVSIMAFLAVFYLKQMFDERKQMEEELYRSEEKLHKAFLTTPHGVAITRLSDGMFLYANPGLAKLARYPLEKIIGRTVKDLNFWANPEDRRELLKRLKEEGEVSNFEIELRAMDGKVSPMSISASLMEIDDEKCMVSLTHDITERKQVEIALKESENKYRTLFEQSADAILIIEGDKFVDCNQATVKMLGYKNKKELLETHPSELSPETQPDGRNSFEKANEMMSIALARGSHRFEWDHQRQNKEVFPVEVLLTAVPLGERTFIHVVWRDITERRLAAEKLSYQASHDSLTGLTNRRAFEHRAERILATVKQDRKEHALCFMDLDQFKVINDTCGHTAGDEMLRQLSLVLQSAVSNRDTLARLGGDEFGVLLEHCSIDDAHRVTTSLQQAIQNYQFSWEGRSFKVGVSMGLVPITEATSSLTELLRDADIACYMAKEKGRNRIHLYNNDDFEVTKRQGEMQWVTRINQALEDNRFCLYAQSIVPLDNTPDKHYELLIRMLDEKGGIILPDAFLPAAERYNLITKIDHWVFDNAISLIAANPSILDKTTLFTINISGQSLNDHKFLDLIISRLDETGTDSEKICFEITETTAISNMIAAKKFISTLKGLGCRFALDDFGSGLSSFGYLKNLPVDYLKIDGIFVKDIADDPIDHAMVKSINDIGHVMGMKTIAEFVENDVIKGMLKEIGVNYAQGYGIEKPFDFNTLFNRLDNITNITTSH